MARSCVLTVGVARSKHYARQAAAEQSVQPRRHGRKPVVSDKILVARIHKVWARLRHRGIPVSKERARRLMREHGLQAPHRAGYAR